MKLDATVFRYITKDEFRVLSAVEMGMKNHELVPVPLIESIAKITRGGTFKLMANLLKHKLLAHENKVYDGYRLTYKGYDFLALRALAARGSITSVGRRIGVGKESDVHCCSGANGEVLAIKLHRLGRISFRAVKSKRDYMQGRQGGSWQYMARLAALKEFAYMKALFDEGFPVPTPIDQNRHCVVMSMIDATPMYSINAMPRAQFVLEKLMKLLVRLARAGIVHGDFNEFNLLIGDEGQITLIDFPQIVHLNHPNAHEWFDRDVRSVCEYFRKKCDLVVEEYPSFDAILAEVEADGGAVLQSLQNVKGLKRDDDAMLVAAHGSTSNRQQPGDRDGSDEDDDSQEEEEDDDDATDGIAELVPEGGRTELAEPEDDIDGTAGPEDGPEATREAAKASGYEAGDAAAAAAVKEGDEASSDGEEDESDDETEGEEAAPGQVVIAAAKKKTRRKVTAKEATANLKKQQKVKPAKANNMKVKEMRNAKHNIKEYMDC